MIIVNLFIGIIINSLLDIREEHEKELLLEESAAISSELADIYQQLFSNMNSKQFLTFWHMGTVFEVDHRAIIVEGERPKHLLLLLDGEVDVLYDNHVVGQLGRGQFLAEMSFITGKPANATVNAKDHVTYMAWPQAEIRALETSDPQLFIQIQGTLGRDLIDKLVATEQAKLSGASQMI